MLFINVLRSVMEELLPKWDSKKYGVQIGEDYESDKRLHYLAFADDTTLIARSRHALKKMLKDIMVEFAAVGLKLNTDKCKIQCSVQAVRTGTKLTVDGVEFPIVSSQEGFSLLGTTYTLNGGTREEAQHRINIAWGKFHSIWYLLRHRASPLRERLRLFNAVVGRALLWGSESWTLTAVERRHLRTVQRSMLRRFAGPRRKADEDWLQWIRQATKLAVGNAEAAGVRCWVHEHLQNKWKWAGHIARMADYRPDSWAIRSTMWRGSKWHGETKNDKELFNVRPLRSRPGRWNRWEDEVVKFCCEIGLDWWEAARDKLVWKSLAPEFAAWSWL